MRDDLIRRSEAIESCAREYNKRFKEGNGLQLAYIEKAINDTPSVWHSVDEPPEDDRYILIHFANFSVPCVGRYNDGNFYDGDDDRTLLSYDLFVDAWMELPVYSE